MANALSIPMAAAAMPNISPIPAGGAAGNALKSMAPAPQMSAGPSPYAPAKPPKNALLQGIGMALDGFQRGFDPQGWQAGRDQRKADGAEKAKQTLALMQQQRALPMEQRMQWAIDHADMVQELTGADIRQMQLKPEMFSDQAMDGQIAAFSAQLGIAPEKPPGPDYQFLQGPDGGISRGDKTSGGLVQLQPGTPKPDTANIRQVGNQIIERQPDGSWKPVYTGSNAEETARAFQGFIDQATGEQMVVMSDGRAKSTGYKAYIPPQITSVGGVPTAVNKLDMSVTPLSPLQDVATNKAGIASAEVQGKAQGQAAFDLPTIEMRSQAAIDSIRDLRSRNIDARFGMQGKLYAIPGTEGADVQALVNQVTSQAFLNAFDQLRGAGAITEREGQAATQAITRLQNQNITVGEAMQAMSELDGYYRKGLEIARQRAVKAPVLPQAAVAGQTPQPVAQPTPAAPSSPSWIAKQGQRFTSMAQPAQPSPSPQQSAYQPGAIDVDEDTGEQYRFKGGDPTDPRNWEPVR